MRRALLSLFMLSSVTSAQTSPSFSNADYQRTLRDNSRVLFYSLSPGMPLSLEGLKEIRLAAEDLQARLIVLVDPAATAKEITSIDDPEVRVQKSSQLRDAGLQLHYPSVLVANNHRIAGRPIAGFKSRQGYVTLVSDLLKLRWSEEFRVAATLPLPRPMSAFFKPIYGTDMIVSGSSGPSYLLNLRTGQFFNIRNASGDQGASFGSGDPGPSKDGEFVTLLRSRGLMWFSTADILAGNPSMLLEDPGLRTYQSMGQLTSGAHRVLGAVSSSFNPAGLIVREYEKRQRTDGGATVSPLGEWRALCVGKKIAIPMLSKTGLYLSGTYDGTMRVFRIGADASDCTEVFDAKMISGKADFSADDRYLLYVSRTELPSTKVPVDAIFLADLQNRSARPIYHAAPETQLAFPGFMSPDRLVVYDQTAKNLITIDRTRRILD